MPRKIPKGNILWLVAARSGSKSIPDKNIKLLGGIELLAYRIKSALHIADPDDVWISTDSEKYAEIARHYGAKVPFIRPAELATDTATSVDVVLHAMEHAEQNGGSYNMICLLEPTLPFVPYDVLLDAAITLIDRPEADNLVAVKEVSIGSYFMQRDSEYLAEIADRIRAQEILRRQDSVTEITPSGCFYFARWEALKQNRSFYTHKTLAYKTDDMISTEIDEPIDFLWSKFLLSQGLIALKEII